MAEPSIAPFRESTQSKPVRYNPGTVQTSELAYDLPSDLIAQTPVEPRDSSRLMGIERSSGQISHRQFLDIAQLLRPGDLLVANDTSVLNARLAGHKPSGGKAEVLLLRKLNPTDWECLVGGRRVEQVLFDGVTDHPFTADVIERRDGPTCIVRFSEPVEPYLSAIGEMPLPPYIHEKLQNPARYQTVYARMAGSAAAPTAGLHFTSRLLSELQSNGVGVAFVTLHVGLDTFKPIDEAEVEAHQIHTEWCEITPQTALAIRETHARGGRIIAVGTTSLRVLETWGEQGQPEAGWSGFTHIYITPGFQFKVCDALITNFHLPRSTLLALVGAFMGLEPMQRAYAEAIRQRYRFYSFGDAMLIA